MGSLILYDVSKYPDIETVETVGDCFTSTDHYTLCFPTTTISDYTLVKYYREHNLCML